METQAAMYLDRQDEEYCGGAKGRVHEKQQPEGWESRHAAWLVKAPASLVLMVIAVVILFATFGDMTNASQHDHDRADNDYQRSRQLLGELTNMSVLLPTDQHKPLLPLDSTDILGFVLSTVSLMIAAGGGIGGGGILIPIYIIIMDFSPRYALPLSIVTVFGGSIANTLANLSKRHPSADRPLIDWDLILVMEPPAIAGALIGAFLNKILPELLLTVLLVILLSYTAWTTLEKAIQMYKKENRQIEQAAREKAEMPDKEYGVQGSADETKGLLGDGRTTANNGQSKTSSVVQTAHASSELQAILDKERRIPLLNVAVLTSTFLTVLALNLLKGGGAFKSPLGIKCGSPAFWLSNLFLLLFVFVVTMYIRQLLIQKYQQKEACRYPYVEGDIKWDPRATLVYPSICCSAGFFAGLFGVVSHGGECGADTMQ
jgi:uncharacterized membrane protein YfcA